ncbi:uncharacterized protein LOC141521768 [Macrotis lagotis]|uniref:uncharacterized protein LOC141521768 n=1 Tax=Macrotis lagotis TaxID=92651 RepID=UPI003D693FAB
MRGQVRKHLLASEAEAEVAAAVVVPESCPAWHGMAGSVSFQRRRRQRQQWGQLMEKLQASSRQFTSIMGNLVAKYNHPFEGDTLVHMSTLTYQTPLGLREWGGKLVTKRILQNIQISLEKEYSIDEVTQSTVTDIKGKRNDNILKNDNLQSLAENDLDKKSVVRVDVILEDEHPRLIEVNSFSKKNHQSHPMILSSKAFLDHSSNGPWKTNGIPDHPTSSLQGPQDIQVSPNQSLVAWRAKRNHLSRSLCVTTCEDEESAQDLKLSDIYAEMLYSLFKCLPSQKSNLVSTNKYTSKVRSSKKRRLSTFTMENSFLKMNQKFQIIPGEENSLIGRKNFKQNILPYSEPNSVAKDNELLTIDPICFPSVSSPSSALRGALYNLSIQQSPSRTTDGRQAVPSPSQAALSVPLLNLSIQQSCSRTMVGRQAASSPSQSSMGSQSPSAFSLCLPPNLTSAKERFHSLQHSSPEGDTSRQERLLSRSIGMPRLPQTPKNAPLSHERLCEEFLASAPSEACPRTGFPRKNETGTRKALPFGMRQTCKAQDSIDTMFEVYSQGIIQWAQLLSLRKFRQKSKMLTASPWDDLQGLQKSASPQGIARNSLFETVSTMDYTALPRTTLKEDFSSPTKRRKVSDSQTWESFNSSKMRDKM